MSTVNGSGYRGRALDSPDRTLPAGRYPCGGRVDPCSNRDGGLHCGVVVAIAWSLGVASWRMWDIARWKKQVSPVRVDRLHALQLVRATDGARSHRGPLEDVMKGAAPCLSARPLPMLADYSSPIRSIAAARRCARCTSADTRLLSASWSGVTCGRRATKPSRPAYPRRCRI